MLLGYQLLEIARIWQHREKIEYEAAGQFKNLQGELEELQAPQQLIDMAARAAADEIEHARLCRQIIENNAKEELPSLPFDENTALGPESLGLEQRALYRSVAVSCIT